MNQSVTNEQLYKRLPEMPLYRQDTSIPRGDRNPGDTVYKMRAYGTKEKEYHGSYKGMEYFKIKLVL